MPRTDKPTARSTSPKPQPGPRELIVLAKPTAALRARAGAIESLSGANLKTFTSALSSGRARLAPLFGNEDRVLRATSTAAAAAPVAQMPAFYKVETTSDSLEKLADKLLNTGIVEAAYIRPPVEPPVIRDQAVQPASLNEAPPISPDFRPRQRFLEGAPAGVDAAYAWARPGGKGQGVRIIDIEAAWRFSHEDLVQNQGGVIGGVESLLLSWRDHGTAVIGVFSADENSFGVTGIAPAAHTRAISIFGENQSIAKAIADASNALSPGDIILIELHAAGPRFNFTPRGDQAGYVPMEYWPDIFAAILYATSVRGVIVVEAGGNGAEDLDDPIYSVRPPGFPPNWTNPFNPANPQSGAILVGAGAPPPGTHNRSHGPDRSRLHFSNFGSRFDAQGWGREVTTCGYGDLQSGSTEDAWYTDVFAGTSSASPIVVGALACTQGFRKASAQPLLTPATAQNLLRTTGSPQQDGPNGPTSERIGNRPNLRQMIPAVQTVPLYRYWNAAAGDHFFTTDWNELGKGKYGWIFELDEAYVLPEQVPGSVPLYRYWNSAIADHFYTTKWSELGQGRYGWVYEKIQCYVYPTRLPGTHPLHRYWNPKIGDHFYTIEFGDLGHGRRGYIYEGIEGYAFAEQRTISETLAQPIATASDPQSVPATFRIGEPPTEPGTTDAPPGEDSFQHKTTLLQRSFEGPISINISSDTKSKE